MKTVTEKSEMRSVLECLHISSWRFVAFVLAFILCVSLIEAGTKTLELTTQGKMPRKFRLEKNDVWVMVGDSITEQRLHTNYIEAFFRTRYPDLALRFRNSGVGCDTAERVDKRFAKEVAVFRPNIVSIELGMNDAWLGWDRYRAGLESILGKVNGIGARALLISSSPVNDGSSMGDWQSERCCQIHPLTSTLEKIGDEAGVPVIDQFHPLLAIWSGNMAPARLRAQLERASSVARIAGDSKMLDKIETLREDLSGLIEEQVALGGDEVHPGPIGQYTMAAVILEQLGVDHKVSSATLDSAGKLIGADNCEITDIRSDNGRLSFVRVDRALPWPVEREYWDALFRLIPDARNLSQYMLTVRNLPEGNYVVSMDGQDVAVVSAQALSDGWNMAWLDRGPVIDQSTKIIAMIRELQGRFITDFRTALSNGDDVAVKKALQAMDAFEQELVEACRPRVLRVEVVREGIGMVVKKKKRLKLKTV